MKRLFRHARLIDPATGRDEQGDLLVADRRIVAVGGNLEASDAETIDCAGAVLAPGLIDACAFRADPEACVAGGITSVVLMPDQSPVLDDAALIEHAGRLGKPRLWVYPLAAATKALNGRELAELALMREAGAVGVATGRHAIQDAQVMLRLLRYAAGLGMVVVAHPECPDLTRGAVATAGEVATRLGLPAAPAMAEAVQVARDIRLAAEAGAALHFACISTAESVELVRSARAGGQDVTAATTPEYALLSDLALMGYRSFARLSPPLRSDDDRRAVVAGLADGTISMLVSRHDPRDQEAKRQPFVDAAAGAAGAATLLATGLSLVAAEVVSLPRLLALLGTHPAARFGLPGGSLGVGAPADLLLFDAGRGWRIEADRLPGRAGNTPFDGLPVAGRVLRVLKGGDMWLPCSTT